jgi:hypothetical protein
MLTLVTFYIMYIFKSKVFLTTELQANWIADLSRVRAGHDSDIQQYSELSQLPSSMSTYCVWITE